MAKLISRTTLSGETRLSSCKGNLLNTDSCMGNLLYTDKYTESLLGAVYVLQEAIFPFLTDSPRTLHKTQVFYCKGFGFYKIKLVHDKLV